MLLMSICLIQTCITHGHHAKLMLRVGEALGGCKAGCALRILQMNQKALHIAYP